MRDKEQISPSSELSEFLLPSGLLALRNAVKRANDIAMYQAHPEVQHDQESMNDFFLLNQFIETIDKEVLR